jgi:hypothetical protein
VAGLFPVEYRSGDRACVPAKPLWRLVDKRVGEDGAVPIGEPVETGFDAGVADVGDDRRSPRRPAQP